MRQTVADGWQHIIHVIGCAKIQRLDPAGSTPDRGFLHTDIDDVILATTGCCIRSNLLTQDAFFQCNPVQLDTCFSSVSFGNLLHVDHVTIVHNSNCKFSSTCITCKTYCGGHGHRRQA